MKTIILSENKERRIRHLGVTFCLCQNKSSCVTIHNYTAISGEVVGKKHQVHATKPKIRWSGYSLELCIPLFLLFMKIIIIGMKARRDNKLHSHIVVGYGISDSVAGGNSYFAGTDQRTGSA